MMRWYIASVYDAKSHGFTRPFFSVSEQTALREISSVANDSDGNLLHRFPEDYSVYHFGFWDDEDGSFELVSPPVSIARVLDLVKVKES